MAAQHERTDRLSALREDLRRLSRPDKAEALGRFFKTGKGQYGEGDLFLGVVVPDQRRVAAKYSCLAGKELRKLISSPIHEERLVCLIILILKFRKSDFNGRKEIFDFYLKHLSHVNNWDLVDISSGVIVGEYLLDKDRSLLYELARSEKLWERRISIISTSAFIKTNDFRDALRLARLLLPDKHDLIHKAVGWMLREVGKRDLKVLQTFLDEHHKKMPRTMLRYAIEKFPEHERRAYLNR